MIEKFISIGRVTEMSRILRRKGQFVINVYPQVTKEKLTQWFRVLFQSAVIDVSSKRPIKKERRKGKRVGYPIRYKQMVISVRRESLGKKPKFKKTKLLPSGPKPVLFLPEVSSASEIDDCR